MRSVSVAVAALIGAAAANPVVEWPRNYEPYNPYNPYPTGASSSTPAYEPSSTSTPAYVPYSSSTPAYVPSSSTPAYVPYSSSTPAYVPYSSSTPVYVPSSSSTGYPIYPVSSSTPLSSYGTGYVPSSTKGGEYTPYPPYGTGVSSSKPVYPPLTTGYPTTETEVITTYTTETVCPVTKTYGTQVITTLTTSTITITSCKAGCHHEPTPPASTPAGPVTVPTTITTTTYTFVPCSTPVGTNGGSVIYSTYLTASYYPTTYVTSVVVYPTVVPQPPVYTPQPPVVTPVYTPPANCPAPVTVTEKVYVTVAPEPCHACETKTYTITEYGTETYITVTVTPTGAPQPPASSYVPNPPASSESPKPPMSTGASGTGYIPYPTNHGPYPTKGASSVVYSSSRVGPKPTGYYYPY